VLIILALDFFIIRWVWGRTNAGSDPVPGQTDEIDADAKTEQTNTNSKGSIGKNR